MQFKGNDMLQVFVLLIFSEHDGSVFAYMESKVFEWIVGILQQDNDHTDLFNLKSKSYANVSSRNN